MLALTRLGGAARFVPLRRSGVPQRALEAAVGRGDVVRHGLGLYALPWCTPARLAAAGAGGVPSCADALEELRLPVVARTPERHVLVPRGTERSWPGAVVHRRGRPVARGRLDVVAALLSLARCAPAAVAVSAVDRALRERRCTLEDLLAVGGPRDAAWRGVLALADARAMSDLESLARVDLTLSIGRRGVPVEVQVPLDGVGSVDLLVDDWVIVETDGFAHHADRDSYRRDRHRDLVAAAHGYAHLRFTYEWVVPRDGLVVAAVEQVLLRGRAPHWCSLRRSSG